MIDGFCEKHWEDKQPCPACDKENWQESWETINNKLIEFEDALKEVQKGLSVTTLKVAALASILEDDLK